MRIKSDFKDYYDGPSKNDLSGSVVYLRKPFKVQLAHSDNPFPTYPKYIYRVEGKRHNRVESFTRIIGVGGLIYPMFCIHYGKWYASTTQKSLDSFCKECGLSVGSSCFDWLNPKPVKFFEYFGSDHFAPHFKHPVFVLENKEDNRYQRVPTLEYNAPLRGTGIESILNVYQCYDLVDRWLCNQARPEKPIPTLSNDNRVEAAGFDLKTSFRKQKEES